jgi:SpoVK/Ycf46/Vps4 family AAA+-type ATPase
MKSRSKVSIPNTAIPFHGSSIAVALFVEVIPLSDAKLTNFACRQNLSQQEGLRVEFDSHKGVAMGYLYTIKSESLVVHLPNEDPASSLETIPCRVRIYYDATYCSKDQKVVIPPSCLVRVVCDDFVSNINSIFLKKVLTRNNPETIQQVSLLLKQAFSKNISIGTSASAFKTKYEQRIQRNQMRNAIRSYCKSQNIPLCQKIGQSTQTITATNESPLSWEPSIVLHSPNHADGKTLLAQAMLQEVGCNSIYILSIGQLLAQYGAVADSAFETLLHEMVLSAAFSANKIGIIFDHLDTWMPARLSSKSMAGDAAAPILNAMASFLNKLILCIKREKQWPFPIKNPLYSPCLGNGRTLEVKVCLISITTCPDDSPLLKQSLGVRYCVPLLDASTRINAFHLALEKIPFNPKGRKRLTTLAASAAWAKASAFDRVESHLQYILKQKKNDKSKIVTVQDLETSFAKVQREFADFAQVSFPSSFDDDDDGDDSRYSILQSSVGGNLEAKMALEDALALDKDKQTMLARFGLTPPTGVLLYGPPGCGKTLLAKAVSNLLKGNGTFVSLSSADIVRAEIGTSEKMVVSAFELAHRNAPSVVFLDEFQALFTERSRGGSGKLATTLLQCLDDVSKWQTVDERRVIVLAATNSPWMVDGAFLRPGRFDRVVHVGLPTCEERDSILTVHISRMKIATTTSVKDLCHTLAQLTEGYSGADLAALCRAAAIRTLMDNTTNTAATKEEIHVEDSHFLQALKDDVYASSDDELVNQLLSWKP